MNTPELVLTDLVRVDGKKEEYCEKLKDIIKMWSVYKGERFIDNSFRGWINFYEDNNVKLVYKESAYGNDHYYISVRQEFWDQIPKNVNPKFVCENGWIDVFHYQDSPDRKILYTHIPGDWFVLVCQ